MSCLHNRGYRNPIICSDQLKLSEPSNDNIAITEVKICLAAHAQRLAEGQRPVEPSLAFWKSFSPEQIQAAQNLYYGFQRLYGGSGYRTQDYSFMPKVKSTSQIWGDRYGDLFLTWVQKVKAERLSLVAILEVLMFGQSCRSVDKQLGRRKGYARKNLAAGLDLYDDLRGEHTRIEKNT